jgi:alpha-1,3-rhamnosyl/mannosyltransferase
VETNESERGQSAGDARIRVLQVIDSGMIGGGQEHVYLLLKGLDRSAFACFLACPEDGPLPSRVRELGIPVDVCPMRRGFPLFRLVGILKRRGIHVVHAHGTHAALWARLAALIARTPVTIYTMHGIHYLNSESRLRRAVLRSGDRLLSFFTELTICVSESDHRNGQRRGVLSPLRSRVILNGIELDRFPGPPEARNELRRRLGIPDSAPVIGIIARLHRQKGHPFFLEAVLRLSFRYPELQAIVAGSGPEESFLREFCRRLGIEDRVHFLGGRFDVPEILAALDVFVLSSLWEGLPLSLLEAMASSLPIVATAVDGVQEALEHRKSGLLVPRQDPIALARAIQRLLDDPALARRLSENARAEAQRRFECRPMVAAVERAYLDCCQMRAVMHELHRSRPRIGIDARKIRDYGIGTYLQNILRNITALDPHSDYLLFGSNPAASRSLEGRPNVFWLPDDSPKYSVRELLVLPWKIWRSKIDLFHAPHYVLPPIRPCKAVVTIHDVIHLLFPEYLPFKPAYYYAKLMLGMATRSARRVITVSECSRRDIVHHLGVPEEKVIVIPNAIHSQFRRLDPAAARAFVAREFQLEGPYILYVGSLSPHKNVTRLLYAFARLRARLPGDTDCLQLVLVGHRPAQEAQLARTVRKLQLEDDLRLLGRVSAVALTNLYNAASLFVFPSLYEGFGLPPLEAMACGTPVVAAASSSLEEVLGDACLAVDPFDIEALARGMEAVLCDERLAARLQRRGLVRARRFSWEQAARQTLAVYREVLAEP